MMTKIEREETLAALKAAKIVAIIRGVAKENLEPLFEALYEGGIRFVEITFNPSAPNTDAATAAAIGEMKKIFSGKLHVGAGTVMTQKQAKLAVLAGAEFLISPNTNPKIIGYAVKNNVISLPGAYTPTEIAQAYDAGADAVKVFPADSLGVPYFKAVMASMSHIPLMAVGGVNDTNVADYLKAGLFGVGVGSALTPKKEIAAGNFAAVTEMAKKYTQNV